MTWFWSTDEDCSGREVAWRQSQKACKNITRLGKCKEFLATGAKARLGRAAGKGNGEAERGGPCEASGRAGSPTTAGLTQEAAWPSDRAAGCRCCPQPGRRKGTESRRHVRALCASPSRRWKDSDQGRGREGRRQREGAPGHFLSLSTQSATFPGFPGGSLRGLRTQFRSVAWAGSDVGLFRASCRILWSALPPS